MLSLHRNLFSYQGKNYLNVKHKETKWYSIKEVDLGIVFQKPLLFKTGFGYVCSVCSFIDDLYG